LQALNFADCARALGERAARLGEGSGAERAPLLQCTACSHAGRPHACCSARTPQPHGWPPTSVGRERLTAPLAPRHRAAEAGTAEDAKEAIAKTLPRLALFGALPPSILPVLLSVRKALDVHKNVNKKLLRLAYYLIQLACSDGSGGTVLPFSLLAGARARTCMGGRGPLEARAPCVSAEQLPVGAWHLAVAAAWYAGQKRAKRKASSGATWHAICGASQQHDPVARPCVLPPNPQLPRRRCA
jgi:hypothetical protein